MKGLKSLSRYRNIILILVDFLCIMFSYYIGAAILQDAFFNFSVYYLDRVIYTGILYFIIYEIIFHITKRNKNIIRYEEGKDYLVYVIICITTAVITSLSNFILNNAVVGIRMNILAGILISVLMISYRVVARYILVHDVVNKGVIVKKNKDKKNLLIIGAGNATHEIIKNIDTNFKSEYEIIGIIDDNVKRMNYTISGVKIIGNRNDIIRICKENDVDLIFFAIARIDNTNKKEILNICQQTKAKVRVLPGIREIIDNKKDVLSSLRDIEIEDILGRDPVKLDNSSIESLIKNHTILVTGGGGSIGSELCRQIMNYKPERLVILDIYENSLYDIELELKDKYPDAKIDAVIASIRDKKRLDEVFDKYHPYLVFHAAAHKHVPLMESSPLEAIKNNVFGTYNVVNTCDEYKVNKFILISTDKAVNPTNIMGATKRLCEMIVQAKNKVSDTEYAAVRFGNVLGSNGSVVPLFKKQIAKGGPVTVTHKEITRFFMTIPEAVELVLQAMTYAKGGEIFVLDMGEPVKIYDLAENLIRLSGLVPGEDIKIEVTGLRPGEKLYEEILMNEEGLKKTSHKKIYVAEPMNISMNEISNKLDKLKIILEKEDTKIEEIKETIKEVVPTYKEPKNK